MLYYIHERANGNTFIAGKKHSRLTAKNAKKGERKKSTTVKNFGIISGKNTALNAKSKLL